MATEARAGLCPWWGRRQEDEKRFACLHASLPDRNSRSVSPGKGKHVSCQSTTLWCTLIAFESVIGILCMEAENKSQVSLHHPHDPIQHHVLSIPGRPCLIWLQDLLRDGFLRWSPCLQQSAELPANPADQWTNPISLLISDLSPAFRLQLQVMHKRWGKRRDEMNFLRGKGEEQRRRRAGKEKRLQARRKKKQNYNRALNSGLFFSLIQTPPFLLPRFFLVPSWRNYKACTFFTRFPFMQSPSATYGWYVRKESSPDDRVERLAA